MSGGCYSAALIRSAIHKEVTPACSWSVLCGGSYHRLYKSWTRLQRVFYQPCLIPMGLQSRQGGSEPFPQVRISHCIEMVLEFLQRGLVILQGVIHVGAVKLMTGQLRQFIYFLLVLGGEFR